MDEVLILLDALSLAGCVRLTMVRLMKVSISRTLPLWKYPNSLTSSALPRHVGSMVSPFHFHSDKEVTFMATRTPRLARRGSKEEWRMRASDPSVDLERRGVVASGARSGRVRGVASSVRASVRGRRVNGVDVRVAGLAPHGVRCAGNRANKEDAALRRGPVVLGQAKIFPAKMGFGCPLLAHAISRGVEGILRVCKSRNGFPNCFETEESTQSISQFQCTATTFSVPTKVGLRR